MSSMVIVGAGECGVAAAMALRAAGWTGKIDLIGSEHHPPYSRPPLSKSAIVDDMVTTPTAIYDAMALRSAELKHHKGIRALHIDVGSHEVELDNGQTLGYERLLLATGANPRSGLVAVPGGREWTLRTFDDAVRLRARLQSRSRVLIVGGGLIGLEVAASARERGCDVMVIESAPRLLGRVVPHPIAQRVESRHCQGGVVIRCNTTVTTIDRADSGLNVHLSDGTSWTRDVVLTAAGAVPETSLASAAGLDVSNGIRVDEHLRTSDPHVYAAGDCCSFPHRVYGHKRMRLESWRNAQDQAQVAARNMCGESAVHQSIPWFWSEQYELTLQVCGLPGEAHTHVARARSDGSEIWFGLDEGGRLVSAAGIGVGNAVAKEISIAEKAIDRGASPDPTVLAGAANLKEILRN